MFTSFTLLDVLFFILQNFMYGFLIDSKIIFSFMNLFIES